MDKIFAPFLPPWAETGLQPAFYDVESGTVLQQTARMYSQVQKLTRLFNELSEETQTLVNHYIEEFTTLYNYVHDYFDNLDVQEEINNKLDAMAEDGTLEAIIAGYIEARDVEFIFPKNWDTYSGDACLIKAYGKSILIDTHRASVVNLLEEMLTSNGVEHLDYVILSHYHDDHVGGFTGLVTDEFIDENTKVYLPMDVQLIHDSESTEALYQQVNSIVSVKHLDAEIPEENSYFEIGKLKCTFYNTNADDFDASGQTNYNNASTMCKIEHGSVKALFTGDCLGWANGRARRNMFINEQYDLYKIEHHAIAQDDTFPDTLRIILPKYAVHTGFLKDMDRNIYSGSTTAAYLQSKGSRIFSCYYNRDYIIFKSDSNALELVQGKQTPSLSNRGWNTFLVEGVDVTTTNTYRDGTTEYPFKTLKQALGGLDRTISGGYRIRLQPGDYDEENGSMNANDVHLHIRGSDDVATDVILHGDMSFFNSYVHIQDCTIKPTDATALYLLNTKLKLTNCIIDGSDVTDGTAIHCTDSDVYCIDCTFINWNMGISSHHDNIRVLNSTFENISGSNGVAIFLRESNLRDDNITYTNVTTPIQYEAGSYRNGARRETVWTGGVASGEITLSRPVSNYNKLYIISGAAGSGTLYTSVVSSFNDQNFTNGTFNFDTLGGKASIAFSNGTLKGTITNTTGYNIRGIYGVKEDLLI